MRKQCVLDHYLRHRVSGVCELVPRADVTGSVDTWIGRLQPVVHFHPGFIVFDPDCLQSKPFHVRRAADTDQNLIDRDVVLLAMRIDGQPLPVVRFSSRQIFGATEYRDAVVRHGGLHEGRSVAILVRHHAVKRFDQIHLTTESREGLSEFASNRTSSNDTQAWWQLGQRKDRLVGKIAGLLQPWSRRSGGSSAGADYSLLETQSSVTCRARYLDGVGPHKAPLADIYIHAQ